MKIIACLSVYNEAQFLGRVLQGLFTHGIDAAIAVDGAYQGFPHEAWHSTDGTLDILAAWKQDCDDWLTVVPAPAEGWEGQEVKRTVYFREADKIAVAGDWLLQVDGDEELVEVESYAGVDVHDWLQALPADKTTAYTAIRNWNGDEEQVGNWDHWAKLYRWMPGLHYGREHWDILSGDGRRIWDLGLNMQSPQAAVCGFCRFNHWTDSRHKERLDAKSQYEEFRRAWRERHGAMNPNPRIEVAYG